MHARSIELRTAMFCALALALFVLAWWPAWSAPYQYDDFVTPLKDPASQSLRSWGSALPNTLRPLTKLSFAIEASLGLGSAAARRVFQGALLVACAGSIAALARRARLPFAGCVALASAWAVHPVQAEMLIALAGRSALFALCLTLASALCTIDGRSKLALTLAVLAVLARETACVWLVACAALVARERRLDLQRTALALAAAGSLAVGLVLASTRMRALLVFSFDDPEAWNRLGLQWAALSRGTLMLLVAPASFNVDMEFTPVGIERAGYLLLTLAFYAGAGWLALRREASLALRTTSAAWISVALPLHGVVPKLDPLTARAHAVSSAALCVLLSFVLVRLLAYGTRARRTLCAIASLALLALVSVTRARASLYADPVALWRDAAQRSAQGTRPWVNLGTLLAQKGQLYEARAALLEALRRNPNGTDIRERLSAVDVLISTRSLLTEPEVEKRSHEARPR